MGAVATRDIWLLNSAASLFFFICFIYLLLSLAACVTQNMETRRQESKVMDSQTSGCLGLRATCAARQTAHKAGHIVYGNNAGKGQTGTNCLVSKGSPQTGRD